MKRRDFLKYLGIGAASAPAVVKAAENALPSPNKEILRINPKEKSPLHSWVNDELTPCLHPEWECVASVMSFRQIASWEDGDE